MLSRLDRLPADARERVLAVENVDGAPVVVTRMILDFDSFGKWLDRVSPAAPTAAPPSGGFTDIFVPSGTPKGAPVAEIDSKTVSWTPPSVPKTPPSVQKTSPPPEPKSEPKPHAPAISVRFREPGSGPKPPAAPPPPPPKAPAPPPAAPGEFTRIFGATRSEPDPVPPPQQFMPPPPPMPSGGSSSGPAPSATSAMERVVAPPPRPAAPPPPPPLTPSSPWSGPPPVVPLPPSPSGSATPMPGANINLPPSAPVMPAQPVQSDFTRIIGAAGPSPVAPVTPAAPAPAPAPASTPAPVAAASKKIAAVLIGFGALLLAALGLVVMALIKRH
jgi:hypothetical protein